MESNLVSLQGMNFAATGPMVMKLEANGTTLHDWSHLLVEREELRTPTRFTVNVPPHGLGVLFQHHTDLSQRLKLIEARKGDIIRVQTEHEDSRYWFEVMVRENDETLDHVLIENHGVQRLKDKLSPAKLPKSMRKAVRAVMRTRGRVNLTKIAKQCKCDVGELAKQYQDDYLTQEGDILYLEDVNETANAKS